MSIKKGNKVIAGAPLEPVWGNITGNLQDQEDLRQALSEKAELNSPIFTGIPLAPSAPADTRNNQIATTKFVQDAIEGAGSDLPDQQGHAGQYLTTNGTLVSWGTVDALPSQTGQSGKFLTTNGAHASWGKLPEEIFIATYNSTTYSEISTAYNAGKICYVDWQGIPVALSKLGPAQAKFLSLVNKYTMINITVTSEDAWSNSTLYFSLMTQDANKVLITDSSGESTTSSVTSTELGYLSGVTSSVQTQLNDKQTTLVSGTNIKTINNTSILGNGNIDTHELPSQTSQSGKFLTTNGTTASWANIPTEIPSQSGNNGKFLTTNGTSVSWASVDAFPTQAGNNGKFLTTDGSTVSWADTPSSLPSQSGNNGKFLTTNGTAASWASLPTYSSGTGITVSGTTINHSNSVTAGTAGTSSATSGSSLAVPYVTYDAQGHVTASGTHTHTITGFLTSSDVDQTYSGTSTNAQSGVAVKSAIDAAVASVYKPAGSVAFANKPSLSSSIEGNVYNITDDFTTTSDFVEGTGHNYPAGTNIVCINTAESGQTAVYKWDVLAGFVDLSGYVTKDGGSAQQTIQLTSGTGTTAFGVKSRSTSSYISLSGTSGWLGSYGVTSSKEPTFYNGSSYTLAYNIGTGSSNGTISANGSDVSVKGLKSAAYTDSTDYVAANSAITGATKCKITYDSKGLVTSGADLSASDIPDISATYQTKLSSSNKLSADYISDGTTNKTVTATEKSTWSGKQDQLVSGTNIKTINSTSLLGSGDISITGLPSQTSQSGKFLTTNGTTASWAAINALQNTATGSNSLTILGTANANDNNINIGVGSYILNYESVTIGKGSYNSGLAVTIGYNAHGPSSSVVIGHSAVQTAYHGGGGVAIGKSSSTNDTSIAIGQEAVVNNNCYSSIQLGKGTNSEEGSFYVGLATGTWPGTWNNYKLLGSDGIIPQARLASGGTNGQVLMTNGTTASWATISADVQAYTAAEVQTIWDSVTPT